MTREQDLERRMQALEAEAAGLRQGRYRGLRYRSARQWHSLPLYDIALGPDPTTGAFRGHARGVVAIGDIATGVVAIGGLARGVVALGGLAAGLVSFGGLSLGVLLAVRGLAIGGAAAGGGAAGGVAIGGAAVGYVATGGAAVGRYVCGDAVAGTHVLTRTRRDPEAAAFFAQYPVVPCARR